MAVKPKIALYPLNPDIVIKKKKYKSVYKKLKSLQKDIINTELRVQTYPFSKKLHERLTNEPRFGGLFHARIGGTKYRVLYSFATDNKGKRIITYEDIISH